MPQERFCNIATRIKNSYAHVAELVDAADSKSAIRKGVKVRFLSWAHFFTRTSTEGRVFYFEFMIIVYVLESMNDATWYTSMAQDAIIRLKEPNTGKNRFTKGHLQE